VVFGVGQEMIRVLSTSATRVGDFQRPDRSEGGSLDGLLRRRRGDRKPTRPAAWACGGGELLLTCSERAGLFDLTARVPEQGVSTNVLLVDDEGVHSVAARDGRAVFHSLTPGAYVVEVAQSAVSVIEVRIQTYEETSDDLIELGQWLENEALAQGRSRPQDAGELLDALAAWWDSVRERLPSEPIAALRTAALRAANLLAAVAATGRRDTTSMLAAVPAGSAVAGLLRLVPAAPALRDAAVPSADDSVRGEPDAVQRPPVMARMAASSPAPAAPVLNALLEPLMQAASRLPDEEAAEVRGIADRIRSAQQAYVGPDVLTGLLVEVLTFCVKSRTADRSAVAELEARVSNLESRLCTIGRQLTDLAKLKQEIQKLRRDQTRGQREVHQLLDAEADRRAELADQFVELRQQLLEDTQARYRAAETRLQEELGDIADKLSEDARAALRMAFFLLDLPQPKMHEWDLAAAVFEFAKAVEVEARGRIVPLLTKAGSRAVVEAARRVTRAGAEFVEFFGPGGSMGTSDLPLDSCQDLCRNVIAHGTPKQPDCRDSACLLLCFGLATPHTENLLRISSGSDALANTARRLAEVQKLRNGYVHGDILVPDDFSRRAGRMRPLAVEALGLLAGLFTGG
jgi:hypothetical protein